MDIQTYFVPQTNTRFISSDSDGLDLIVLLSLLPEFFCLSVWSQECVHLCHKAISFFNKFFFWSVKICCFVSIISLVGCYFVSDTLIFLLFQILDQFIKPIPMCDLRKKTQPCLKYTCTRHLSSTSSTPTLKSLHSNSQEPKSNLACHCPGCFREVTYQRGS